MPTGCWNSLASEGECGATCKRSGSRAIPATEPSPTIPSPSLEPAQDQAQDPAALTPEAAIAEINRQDTSQLEAGPRLKL